MSTADVDRWFTTTKPPLADVMQRVRAIIVGAGVDEIVKHGSVSFTSKGGDMAAFVQAQDKKRVSLMFMRAGQLAGKYPSLDGNKVKYLRFAGTSEVDAAAKELKAICAEWIALMTTTLKPSPQAKPSVKKKASAKKSQ